MPGEEQYIQLPPLKVETRVMLQSDECVLCGKFIAEGETAYWGGGWRYTCAKCCKRFAVHKPFPKHVEALRNVCVFCKKKIQVVCGTPLIHLGGCCYGHVDKKTKTQYVFPRKAHLKCWKDNQTKEVSNGKR